MSRNCNARRSGVMEYVRLLTAYIADPVTGFLDEITNLGEQAHQTGLPLRDIAKWHAAGMDAVQNAGACISPERATTALEALLDGYARGGGAARSGTSGTPAESPVPRACIETGHPYRNLFDVSADAILVVHQATGGIVDANPAAERLYQYSRAELLTMRHVELSAEPARTARALHRRALSVEHRLHRKRDGTVFPVSISASYFVQEGEWLVFTLIRDETERVAAQEALRESDERFQQIAAHMRDAFWLAEPGNGRVLYASPASEHLYGVPLERLRTDSTAWMTHVHPADRDRILGDLDDQLRGAHTIHEFRVTKSSEGVRWIRARAFPVADANGGVCRVVGISEDITDQKSAEKLLRLQRDLALRLSEAATLDEALHLVLEAICSIESVDAGGVYVREADGALRLAAHRGISDAFVAAVRYYPADAPNARLIESGRPVFISVDDHSPLRGLYDSEGLLCTASFPMRYRNQSIGAINVGSRSTRAFPGRTSHALEAVSSFVAGQIERVRATEALRESEQRYRLLAEYAGDMISRANERGEFFYASPASRAILGYAPEELLGHSGYEYFHADDVPRMRAFHQALLAGRKVSAVVYRAKHKSGELRWLETTARAVQDANGRLVELIGISRDVTDRVRADEALRASEALFRTVMRTLPVGVIIVQDRRIRYANESMAATFPCTDLVGRDALDLVHPEMRARVQERYEAREAESPQPDRYELRGLTADGRELALDVSIGATEYEGRRAYVVAALDITQRKLAEERVRQHQEQLAHVGRISVLGEMTTGLAHELAQPLSAVLFFARGGATRIASGQVDPQHLERTFDKISTQAERAGQIIRRLKEFVRRSPPRREPAELNELVREALTLIGFDLREGGIAVHCEFAPDLPRVVVDPIQIEQVIVNLVRNALEAMQAVPASQRRLLVQTSLAEPHRVRIRVDDSGPGIAPEAAGSLFQPFFTTKPNGLGLGLSISRSLIEAHEGRLWACSSNQGGAAFAFELPTAREGVLHVVAAGRVRGG